MEKYKMYILSEEGELEQDLSKDPLIPAKMIAGTSIVHKEKIIAFGVSFTVEGPKWSVKSFNGKKWSHSI